MILAVLNRKGGVGKSAVSLHLAAALHEQGHRTALVDLDDANRSCLEYVDAVPFLVTDAHAWDQQHARQGWDHVVLDGYARVDGSLAGIARAADLLIVPTAPDASSLRVLRLFLPDVIATGTPYRVLLTLVPPRPSRDGARALSSLRAGGVPTFPQTIPRAAAFTHAARRLQLVWDQPGAARYQLLFHDLATAVKGDDA